MIFIPIFIIGGKVFNIAFYILTLIGLKEFMNKYPNSLSGGMKQRVALIRTLAIKPDILLLDEPFHSQDSEKKDFFLNFTKNFINQQNITLLMISHDKNELNFLCEKIIDETMFCCK